MHMSQVFYQSRGIIGHASNTSPCDFEDALGHYAFLWLKTNMVSANKILPILAVHSGPKLIFLHYFFHQFTSLQKNMAG